MNDEYMDFLLHTLNKSISELNRLSFLVLLSLLLNIATFVISKYIYNYQEYFMIISIYISLTGFLLLYQFDKAKKNGLAAYETLLEELEWGKRNSMDFNDNTMEVQSRLRYTMKKFILSTDLPIMPGKTGQMTFFILFFMLLILTAMFRKY